MTEEQKQKLEKKLWDIANELRGKMDADEFRDYILGFIFYKYLSEKQYLYANQLLETEAVKDYTQVTDEEDIAAIRDESLEKLGYFLRPNELFSAISKKGNADTEGTSNFILEDLQSILNAIEQSTMGTESEDDFTKLFEDLDLSSTKLGRTVEVRNSLISKVLAHLDKIDFELGKVDSDVLGDAYEYLIAQFASGAGKKAGEFYTPQQVSKILAKIVTLDKSKIKSAYDPACGSGSLLLRIAKEAEVGEFFGQELNRTTYNLARMNMILHDVHFSRFDIQQDDTLENPMHVDQRFEAIVANPPFSAKWKGKNNPLNETDDRFSQYGAIAPTSKADFAFVQHMIHHMAENGTACIVLPHGVLFRSGAEATIRQHLIEEQNYLDAVIGLPPNLFYGTAIPACILVLKKCRVHDGNIFFIDASAEFKKATNQNVLNNDHVNKIIQTYERREAVKRYAHPAPLSEVAENGFNLNIPRYVDMFEEEEEIELSTVADALITREAGMHNIERSIAGFCEELGINSPEGSNVSLLRLFKKGCMQQLFTQRTRFKDDQGNEYPDWVEKHMRDVFEELKEKVGSQDLPTFSISAGIGWVSQVEKFGRDISGQQNAKYTALEEGEFSYNKGNSKSYKFGCIYPNDTGQKIAVPNVFISFKRKLESTSVGFYAKLFESHYLDRGLRTLISSGARMDGLLNVNKHDFFALKIPYPHPDEQKKIADFLYAVADKIDLVGEDISDESVFKKSPAEKTP